MIADGGRSQVELDRTIGGSEFPLGSVHLQIVFQGTESLRKLDGLAFPVEKIVGQAAREGTWSLMILSNPSSGID